MDQSRQDTPRWEALAYRICHTYRKPPHMHRWATIEEIYQDAQGRLCAWVRWNITGQRRQRRLEDWHICRYEESN